MRCIFDGAHEASQDSVVTLYLKEDNVNIEVSLYNEPSRMSIASQVHSFDLFGEDPMLIPFKERITPKLTMRKSWSFEQLMNYLESWSAVQRYMKDKGENPLNLMNERLKLLWGSAQKREIHWPLTLRVGLKNSVVADQVNGSGPRR